MIRHGTCFYAEDTMINRELLMSLCRRKRAEPCTHIGRGDEYEKLCSAVTYQ